MSVTIKERLSGFNPLSINGCQLWMDASDSSSGSMNLSGSTVTQWKDKSGNGNNTTAYSGTPTLVSSAINGRSAISMSGGYFTGPFATANTGTQVHAFAVISIDASSGVWPRPLSLGRPGEHDFNDPTTTFAIIRYSGSQDVAIGRNGQYLNVGFPSYSSPFLVQSSHNGPTEFMSINGNLTVNSLNTGQTGNFNITSYGLGINTNTSDYFVWNGYYAEVLYYNVQLSTDDRQKVEGYLAWKWGLQGNLPSGHPYKGSAPEGSLTGYNLTFPLKLKSSNVFVPPQISGCQIWFDGADPLGTGVIPSNGATVSTWVDKSGSGFNATVASGKVAAIYSTANNAMNFASSNTGYVTSYTANPTNETMFVVTNNSTLNVNNFIIIGGQSGARSLSVASTGNGLGSVGNLKNQIAFLASTPGGTYTAGTTVMVTSQFTSSSNSISLNGGTTISGGAPGFTAGTTTYLGVDTTTSAYYYIGLAMEIIFYNSVLNTTQRQQVEGYLAWKWGLTSNLPTSHPFYVRPIAPFSYQYASLQRKAVMRFVTPLLSQGCALWLDANDTTSMTLVNGNQLSQWNDKSGSSRNLQTQGMSSAITLQFNNNVRFINFNNQIGNNAYMNTTAFTQLPEMSMFMVFTPLTKTGSSNYFWTWRPLGASNRLPALQFNTASNTLLPFTTNAGSVGAPSTIMTVGQTYLLYMDFSNNSTNRINLSLNASTTTLTGTLPTFNTFQNEFSLGGDTSGSGSMNLNEVIMYNSILPTAQKQQMEGYLAWKWGLQSNIPSNHPYTLVPPSFPGIQYSNYLVNFPAFRDTTPFYIVSAFPSVGNNELRINQNTTSVAAAVWFSTPINIQTFTTSFVMRFDSTNGDGATFCIQTTGSNALGATGGGLGYQGINRSVCVTLKTYNGANGQFSVDYLLNGNSPSLTGASGVLNNSMNLQPNTTWFFNVLISYNGTTLSWTVRNLLSTSLFYSSNATVNIPLTMGNSNTAFVGFTSGTGGATEACTVSSWLYNN
jgi:hypothetical protein